MIKQIVEDRDCTDAQKQNHNMSIAFRWSGFGCAAATSGNNDQQEYPAGCSKPAEISDGCDVEDYQEILGINDRQQLATAYEILQRRVKSEWMTAGAD